MVTYDFTNSTWEDHVDEIDGSTFIHYPCINGVLDIPNLTFGNRNAELAEKLFEYINATGDEEGLHIDYYNAKAAFKKISDYYQLGLDSAVGSLVAQQLLMPEKTNSSYQAFCQEFAKKRADVEELEKKVREKLIEIRHQTSILMAVFDKLRELPLHGLRDRNQEFYDTYLHVDSSE